MPAAFAFLEKSYSRLSLRESDAAFAERKATVVFAPILTVRGVDQRPDRLSPLLPDRLQQVRLPLAVQGANARPQAERLLILIREDPPAREAVLGAFLEVPLKDVTSRMSRGGDNGVPQFSARAPAL